jgi:hypothetical protein
MEKENQFTILEKETGKLLYCKRDDVVTDDQIAITEMCTISAGEGEEIIFNFETQKFEVR